MRAPHRSDSAISLAAGRGAACNAAMLDLEQSVIADLAYLAPGTAHPVQYAVTPPEGEPRENYAQEPRPTRIADARALVPAASLNAEGFELRDAPSAVRNFYDEDEVA